MKHVTKSVVRVQDIGTGAVVVAPSGRHYVLTNSHVCMYLTNRLLVGTTQTSVTVEAKITKDDPAVDLCAAQVSSRLTGIVLGKEVWPRQQVCTIGYPRGKFRAMCGTLTGTRSSWDYSFRASDFDSACPPSFKRVYSKVDGSLLYCVRHITSADSDLAAQPGASGSPVIDSEGHLVGVVSDWSELNPDYAGLVPFTALQEFMSDL